MLAQKPLNLNAIADQFDVTRQAVSLHIKILNECGLIMITKKGRERYCEAKLEQLDEVADWVTHSKKLWTGRFNALEKLLEEIQTKPHNKTQVTSGIKKKKNGKR